MKAKVSELQGTALDWAVAKCEGYLETGYMSLTSAVRNSAEWADAQVSWSEDWALGGPIIEREWLCVDRLLNGLWLATKRTEAGDSMLFAQSGGSTLIAAMRCYVASKMGDEIEIPDLLITV